MATNATPMGTRSARFTWAMCRASRQSTRLATATTTMAPRVGSFVASYAFDAFRGSAGNASVSLVHVGGFPGMFPNVPGQPGVVSPLFDYTESYTIANANLAFAFDRFTVGAYVENLFDDRSITYVHPEAFLDGRYARVPPRTVGVRVGYRF